MAPRGELPQKKRLPGPWAQGLAPPQPSRRQRCVTDAHPPSAAPRLLSYPRPGRNTQPRSAPAWWWPRRAHALMCRCSCENTSSPTQRTCGDGMRGLSHAFRDHAGLGHPWKGIWAHPVLAAVGVGDCTVRELLLKTSSPSFLYSSRGPRVAALRLCPLPRTAGALVVCRFLDRPTMPSRLRSVHMASFLPLMTWHVSCFMTGAPPEKGSMTRLGGTPSTSPYFER